MNNNNYEQDRRFIMETIKHTAEYANKLDGKFEDFKLETAKSIIVIQTKLAMYVAGGSIVTGVAIKYLTTSLG